MNVLTDKLNHSLGCMRCNLNSIIHALTLVLRGLHVTDWNLACTLVLNQWNDLSFYGIISTLDECISRDLLENILLLAFPLEPTLGILRLLRYADWLWSAITIYAELLILNADYNWSQEIWEHLLLSLSLCMSIGGNLYLLHGNPFETGLVYTIEYFTLK